MSVEKLGPFFEELKSKSNLVFLLIGLGLFADMYFGSPVLRQLVILQCKLFKVNPSAGSFKFVTIFGTFNSVESVARVLDIGVGTISLIISVGSYLKGLVASLAQRKAP
jgi:hypothetical protein